MDGWMSRENVLNQLETTQVLKHGVLKCIPVWSLMLIQKKNNNNNNNKFVNNLNYEIFIKYQILLRSTLKSVNMK